MNHQDAISLAQLAGQAAAKFADVTANAGLVREEFLALANVAHNESLLVDEIPTTTDLLSKWFTTKLDRVAKTQQKLIKKALESPQSVLDFGSEYDLPVLVCGNRVLDATAGRITTLGLLTDHDLTLIDAESAAKLEQSQRAHERQHEGVIRAVPILRQYRDYQTYRRMQAEASA